MQQSPKLRVAIIYHFFAHYRSAVLRALLDCKDIEYLLVGDRSDPDESIKAWQPPEEKLLVAPCLKITRTLLWQKRVTRLAFRRDLDVMIFLGNANFLSTWLAAVLSRLSGKRVLFWTHGWIKEEHGAKARLRNLFYHLSHGLLLYGNRAKTIGIKHGFNESKLYVIYNSLDYDAQRQARVKVTDQRSQLVRAAISSYPNHPLLICTSRLTKLRGLELLLSAMEKLRRQGTVLSLLLVGDGPERASLETLARGLGLAVHFYGPCYDENRLAELIMASNLTVAPGKVGLTAMHSLVYGTPVITHDDPSDQMPEFEAIVSGKTGDFFKRGDVHALAETIHRWCIRPWPDHQVRQQCMGVIDQFYNPAYQSHAIKRAVMGLPAE